MAEKKSVSKDCHYHPEHSRILRDHDQQLLDNRVDHGWFRKDIKGKVGLVLFLAVVSIGATAVGTSFGFTAWTANRMIVSQQQLSETLSKIDKQTTSNKLLLESRKEIDELRREAILIRMGRLERQCDVLPVPRSKS